MVFVVVDPNPFRITLFEIEKEGPVKRNSEYLGFETS
jgi:hypothetical protein